jgi:hypothetical protein
MNGRVDQPDVRKRSDNERKTAQLNLALYIRKSDMLWALWQSCSCQEHAENGWTADATRHFAPLLAETGRVALASQPLYWQSDVRKERQVT